jgi:hypothetical protein
LEWLFRAQSKQLQALKEEEVQELPEEVPTKKQLEAWVAIRAGLN